MRIAIDTIPEDGVRVDVQSDLPWATDAASFVLEASPQTLGGELHVVKRASFVEVRGAIQATCQRTCERCGEPATLAIDSDVDLTYVPAEDAPSGHAEVRLGEGDLDVGWFSAGVIDCSDVLSEALALALPPRIACADTDSCDSRVAALLQTQPGSGDDHPFAALRQLT